MNLQDVLNQLTSGELRNLFVGDDKPLTSDKREQLVPLIFAGLTALHKRFLLKEKTVYLDLVQDQFEYPLTYPDLMQVEIVKSVDGTELPLNLMNDPNSVITPNYKTLVIPRNTFLVNQHPPPITKGPLSILYRANHPLFDSSTAFVPSETVVVELPWAYMEPLIFYVASRTMNPMGSTDQFHEGNNYAQRYEQACQRLEAEGFFSSQIEDSYKFARNGWV